MKNRPLLYVCLLIMAVIVLSVLSGEGVWSEELRPSPLEKNVSSGDTVIVQGQVYNLEQKENYQAVYLKKNSIQHIQKKKSSFRESKIITYIDPNIQLHIGNRIEIQGEVSFFQNARNPGNFDQKRYYQIQDIHGIVWAQEAKVTDTEVWRWRESLSEFRGRWKEHLVNAMGEEDGAVMGAMMLGEKSDMDQELKTLYQANGIGHILAISGLHLSFVGIGMYRILRRITGSYPVGGIAGIGFLMVYIAMIGLTVSAVRALIMFLFRVGADITGRHYDAPTALAAAATSVLLWRPLYLMDGGFWLSFGAVFAILAVLPVMQRLAVVQNYVQQRLQGRNVRNCFWLLSFIRESVLQGLKASISIHMVILPVLLYYFFEFPLYSFFLNLFVIPLMSVLLFVGMLGSICYMTVMPLSKVCFQLCSKILWVYKKSCSTAIALPGARIVTGRPLMWQIIIYYVVVFSSLMILNRKILVVLETQNDKKIHQNSKKLYAPKITAWKRRAVVLWILSGIMLTVRWGEKESLTVTMIDVGQGDGIFLRGPDGGTYLIDGGSSDVKKAGQYCIEPFLKSQGVGRIDYVFISHGDSDHINGVEELIDRQQIGVKIKTLVLPVREVWGEELERLAYKAQNTGIRTVIIQPGQRIEEGELDIICLQPGMSDDIQDAEKKDGRTEGTGLYVEPGNAASMVLAVRYGKFDMLLTGDVEGEGERGLTDHLKSQYSDCTWEVLKTAHHGSKNSSGEEFLSIVRPMYALISAGQENRYGHPHQETLERLKDAGSDVYSTQECGAITIGVKKGRMWVEPYLKSEQI